MSENIADTIRELRESCGMTQDALGSKSGVTQQCISKIESGESSPQWETVERIAGALGAKITVLQETVQQ